MLVLRLLRISARPTGRPVIRVCCWAGAVTAVGALLGVAAFLVAIELLDGRAEVSWLC
jgi:hypothetical protein